VTYFTFNIQLFTTSGFNKAALLITFTKDEKGAVIFSWCAEGIGDVEVHQRLLAQ
jgi:hypothetical protein